MYEYLEGKGIDSIAKGLTAEGVITPSAVTNRAKSLNVWHERTIRLILTNVHYCGDLVQHQSEIVSVTSHRRKTFQTKDIFKQVQQHMAKRTRTATTPQKHLFTNILFCEECKRGMWFKKNQKGYRCGGNIKYGETFCANRSIVRESELSSIFITDFNNQNDRIISVQELNEYRELTDSKINKLQTELT